MTRADSAYWPKNPDKHTAIAEIGVKDGDTSILLAKHLNMVGNLYLFDYEDRADKAARRCWAEGFTNVLPCGNSYKLFDSYNWPLMKLVQDRDREVFDYIYFDGAHTWYHDALAAYLCMRLLKVGGYIDVDDYDHTYAGSPNAAPHLAIQHHTQPLRPRTEDAYTEEQIATKQVKLVVDLVIREDYRFEEKVSNKVFWKVQR